MNIALLIIACIVTIAFIAFMVSTENIFFPVWDTMSKVGQTGHVITHLIKAEQLQGSLYGTCQH